MSMNNTRRALTVFVTLAILFSMISSAVLAASAASTVKAPANPVTFTILHTNDFHGQLEASSTDPIKASNPGYARVAAVVNKIRADKAPASVLLADVGDEMQGSLLSNLQKGAPVIAAFNQLGVDVATFGNHEFDWGQAPLTDRTSQANYPYVTANIVKNDTGNCATAGWVLPDFAKAPYVIKTVGTAPNIVNVAFIGVTTTETPTITIASATQGLCFKDPAASISHYYPAMKAAADVIVVLSHLGFADGGYGYGIPVYGDQTLADKLNKAATPVNLILGGHSHTNVMPPPSTTIANAVKVIGSTVVTQAYYNGRNVGEADITVGTNGSVSIDWKAISWKIPNPNATPPSTLFGWKLYSGSPMLDFLDATTDTVMDNLINGFANDPAYRAIVDQEIGYSAVDLGRDYNNYSINSMMGAFVDDAIYNYLNTDATPANDIDLFFNNSGGIRTDWCWANTAWTTSGCVSGTHAPGVLTYGHMFTILPFGNATVVGTMTGAQILEVLNYAPNAAGMIQPAGLKYKFFAYRDTNPGPQPYAWGAFDVCVVDKTSKACDPLDLKKTYKVGTNEFLAPAGGDSYSAFKNMTNISYWGDMLNAVNAYVHANYGTPETAYKGPTGNGTFDGRIVREGTNTTGSIVPLTILHHNDSHGNVAKGQYVGYTQLATLIKQERLHNPTRTLLLNGGDSIQGDAMMYYFKTAFSGKASDGTPLPSELQMNPLIKAFNTMGYDAMTLGNHEFNFGSEVFNGELKQATFPLLLANAADTGAYGLGEVGAKPYLEKLVGTENIKVAILGIGNHRVPNYELPSNIPGLSFSDPLAKAQELSTLLRPTEDVIIALTHIGFTEDPKSVEVDKNVDSNMAKTVSGIDAIIGSHSHTNPAYGFGDYKYLPSIIPGPDGKPVIVNQAYRYNNTLGEVVLGLRAKAGGGYEVVTETGRYLSVPITTPEDSAIKTMVDPYVAALKAYNDTVIGQTTAPIDTAQAYVGESNGANLQADAAVYELMGKNNIPVDFHLSGAMTQTKTPIAPTASMTNPFTLKISDMFAAMPYENSLVVLNMNGPQLKTVLERAYRNYYYYKYVSGYGGYSYYTTCMLDTNFGNRIVYNDTYPALPSGDNVTSLVINGTPIDFNDAAKYYRVSTVNYLAAGSCNFNNAGVSLWPLTQIANDTQFYVRDAVIDYVTWMGTISPAIEGRLAFSDKDAPVITIKAPEAKSYLHNASITLDFSARDAISGLRKVWADLDGVAVTNGQVIDLLTLSLGDHVLTVYAEDMAGNQANLPVTFRVTTDLPTILAIVDRFYSEGKIDSPDVYASLVDKLQGALADLNKPKSGSATNKLLATINFLAAQSGKHITIEAADLLINDIKWVLQGLATPALQPAIQIVP
ncbi:MAG TPA: 5'-nucleotidase C-terminal domain-containing protein [Anaerolineales bacterium]